MAHRVLHIMFHIASHLHRRDSSFYFRTQSDGRIQSVKTERNDPADRAAAMKGRVPVSRFINRLLTLRLALSSGRGKSTAGNRQSRPSGSAPRGLSMPKASPRRRAVIEGSRTACIGCWKTTDGWSKHCCIWHARAVPSVRYLPHEHEHPRRRQLPYQGHQAHGLRFPRVEPVRNFVCEA